MSTQAGNVSMNIIHSDAFASRVKDFMSATHVLSVSVAVFDDKDITARAFGLACLDPESPATSKTLYDCASCSKSLTAAAVAKLVADDDNYPQVKWNTPVSKLLPDDFVLPDAYATEHVTIEDILSHRSGMARHDFSYLGVRAEHPDTLESLVRSLRHLPMSAPMRTHFEYSNMMYTAAALLVEKVSKQTFAQFLQSNFFDVLGMKDSFLQPSAVVNAGLEDRLAKPYFWQPQHNKNREVGHPDQPEGTGAGLIQSTATDYAKWTQALMVKSGSLLDADSYKQLTSPRIICFPEDTEDSGLEPHSSHSLYALGWEVSSYRGIQIVQHEGGETGYRSITLFVPKLKLGTTILTNGSADLAPVLAMTLVDDFLAIDPTQRFDWAKKLDSKTDDDGEEGNAAAKLRNELHNHGQDECKPQLPLTTYLGTYHHAGYHSIVIDIKDDKLRVDGVDRTMPFELSFEHVCGGCRFIAHMFDIDYDGERLDEDPTALKVEFRISDSGEAEAVGIDFYKSDEGALIWFDRTQ